MSDELKPNEVEVAHSILRCLENPNQSSSGKFTYILGQLRKFRSDLSRAAVKERGEDTEQRAKEAAIRYGYEGRLSEAFRHGFYVAEHPLGVNTEANHCSLRA